MIIVIDNSLKVDNVKKILGALNKIGIVDTKVKVIKNQTQLDKVDVSKVKGIVMSGSEMMVTDADMHKHADKFMLNMCVLARFNGDVPILAICFGCQLVNYVFGGSVRKLEQKIDKVLPIKVSAQNFKGLAKFNCKYVIDKIPNMFKGVGTTVHNGKEIVCLLEHTKRPIVGTLFHPEACDDTLDIFRMFMEC